MKAENEQRFRAMVKHASDVFIILDSHHVIQFVSPAVETMLGYRAEDLAGKPGTDFAPLAEVFVMETSKNKKGLHKRELSLKRADGVSIDTEVIHTNMLQDPGIKGIVITIRDITQKKKAEQAIYHAAFHDYLTDLPNRRMFEEQLDKQLRLAQFYKKKLAVLLIDLDRFKLVNDTLGHSIGDALLKQLAASLQSCLGKGETAYRLGGDEFCIVLDEVKNQYEVMAFSDKIIKIFKKEFIIAGYELNITVSIGMSLCPEDGDTVDSILKNADTALYFAKSQGRDQAQYYSSSLNVQSFKNFTLSNDLRKALDKNEFFLQYMPRVDTKSTQILGAEALIRWNHADWGMVSPAEFIPIAEETGLIVAIGEWVMREACRQNKQWKDMGLPSITISVNFSVQQLLQQNILKTIEDILEETGLSPDRLEVEITESSFMSNEKEVTQLLLELKKRKIKVSLDDFGTGYSSLYLLKRLPLDTIKIDKSFVEEILTDPVNKSIIQCIINLAKSLQMSVVAEGVELEDQYNLLKEEQCDEIQGYYFSRPLNPSDFAKLLKNNQFNQASKSKQAKQQNNRRKYFRIDLDYPLISEMTISMFKGRKLDIGSTEVFVTNIGPSGLRFLMGVKLPVNDDFVLKFNTVILGHKYELYGNIVWFNDIQDGEVYEYGFQFHIEENEQIPLIKNLNLLAIKLREGSVPKTQIYIGDPVARIKARKRKTQQGMGL